MNKINEMIENTLGKYEQDVDDAVFLQIRKIIRATGSFNADDWVLEMKRPSITTQDFEGYTYVFSIEGAIRLVPRYSLAQNTHIVDDILIGGLISQYKVMNPHFHPEAIKIVIKGIQVIDWANDNDLRFSFDLEIRSSDPRIIGYIQKKLGTKP